jgi:solute carrier family 25 carnitine/acylcarnitine transporter 20/29
VFRKTSFFNNKYLFDIKMSEIESNAPEEATALQDLLAGGIAGSCSVIVGHPFDTYKVRLQTSSGKPSLGSISSLFKGMGPPLSTAAVVNALIFSSFGESSRLWDDFFYPEEGHHVLVKDVPNHEHKHANVEPTIPPEHSSWQKSFVCGSLAGAVQALVICPSEHIKCRIQAQSAAQQAQFKGPLDVASKILNGYGLGGLYRGFACTCWREIRKCNFHFDTSFICEWMQNESELLFKIMTHKLS